jgi:hypothetical protein
LRAFRQSLICHGLLIFWCIYARKPNKTTGAHSTHTTSTHNHPHNRHNQHPQPSYHGLLLLCSRLGMWGMRLLQQGGEILHYVHYSPPKVPGSKEISCFLNPDLHGRCSVLDKPNPSDCMGPIDILHRTPSLDCTQNSSFLSLIKNHFGATSKPLFQLLQPYLFSNRFSTLLFLFLLCCISSLVGRA